MTQQAKAGQPVPATTVTAPAKPAPTVTVTSEPKPAPTVTKTVTAEPEQEASGISDGSYEVGTDIKPGRYKTVDPVEGGLCYADVQHKGSYLEQEVTNSGRTIIDVPNRKGAIFKSSGCGDWKRS